jgi:hypothetical protein
VHAWRHLPTQRRSQQLHGRVELVLAWARADRSTYSHERPRLHAVPDWDDVQHQRHRPMPACGFTVCRGPARVCCAHRVTQPSVHVVSARLHVQHFGQLLHQRGSTVWCWIDADGRANHFKRPCLRPVCAWPNVPQHLGQPCTPRVHASVNLPSGAAAERIANSYIRHCVHRYHDGASVGSHGRCKCQRR